MDMLRQWSFCPQWGRPGFDPWVVKIPWRRKWQSILCPLSLSRLETLYFPPLVTQLCLTLCNPMDCSTPGLPVHQQLLEFTQTHVCWVSDAIQPSHPLSSPLFNWYHKCLHVYGFHSSAPQTRTPIPVSRAALKYALVSFYGLGNFIC